MWYVVACTYLTNKKLQQQDSCLRANLNNNCNINKNKIAIYLMYRTNKKDNYFNYNYYIYTILST